MAVVAGVNIPDNKRISVALRSIYGVGPNIAGNILKEIALQDNPRVHELTETQLLKVREQVDKYIVEGDLRREVNDNIRRLVEIKCYRGLRHRNSLPLRGQRTKTNARTKRGSRKTVAGRRRTVGKK
jgi:small subunit ribosomal protein S13